MRLLLIEDQLQTALTIQEHLKQHYIVEAVLTGEEGIARAKDAPYDLIILDYLLPDVNGLIVCQLLRKQNITAPILLLTGQTDVQKKVLTLDSGADDYVTKPFHFDELLARIRMLLRRPTNYDRKSILTVGDLTFDLSKKMIMRAEKLLMLRRKEQYLLEYLMRNPGYTLTREMILDRICDSFNESYSNTVDVHIKYLRDQVDKPFEKKLIKTVHGFGYKIEP